VDRDSKPKPPLVAPQRARQKSHDDLSGLQADDAKEAALRAAAAALERERAATRAEAVARAQAEAERDRNAAEVGRLSVVAASPPDSKTVHAQGKNWKVALPIGAIVALIAPVTAMVQSCNAREQAYVALTATVAGYEASSKKREDELKTQELRITELTNTVARLSGFLAGAFPKLGLQVTAEPGATTVEVRSEPLPASAAKRPQVKVTTPVPAPKPR
jgi:hypothetical protein